MDGVLLPWKFNDYPLCPRAWLAEFERTLRVMAKKGCLPYWLKRPADKNIRDDASASADGFTDPGNYDLDIFVHAMRLWQYCEGSRADLVMKQPISEYGTRSNKSAKGPVNLRGNIVEAMTKNLQQMGNQKASQWKYDPFKYWYQEDHYRSEPIESQSASSSGKSGKGWQQTKGGHWRRGKDPW